MTGAVLATKSFKSPDGEHGRNVQKTEWSPDSQFFVFSTAAPVGIRPGIGRHIFMIGNGRCLKKWTILPDPSLSETSN
jgi:hypothetical protein